MFVTSLPDDSKGFTLLELLVAVSLLAIVLTGLYASFFGVTRARDRVTEGMEAGREISATLDLLRREISSVTAVPDDKQLRFVLEDRDNFGKPASAVSYAAYVQPEEFAYPESGISMISYKIAPKGEALQLMRAENDFLHKASTPRYFPQIEELESFLVECYDGTRWIRSWDSKLNRSLPNLVRITVTRKSAQGVESYSVTATPRIVRP